MLIVVFDAFSAYNISLYGYRRETTPHITRLAERAIVYHNHFAAGNYTTTGTASLLTGVYTWTHRAFQMYASVMDALQTKSIFHAFNDDYRIAYSHNPLTKASVMLVKGRYKLTYYFGYAELESGKKRMELYDLDADPEELNDLYVTQPKLGKELLDELKSKLVEVNKPYRRSRRNSSTPPSPHGRDVAQRATGSEE